ncbi:MAG TPA: MFS transporter, partial [Dissulfurispiraceae bacterium]|nr:MFS transporter [Dissulfurispiraceae bacterium]
MQNAIRFPALRHQDFRFFWIGQLISLSGTWMHSVAQSWLVYSLTHSPLYLGIIASLSSLPILLFTLLGGMVADRFPKRTILMVTQFLSALPALFVAVLADLRIITVWHVGIAALMLGIVNAFDVPTRQSFLAEVVDRDSITNAVALNSAAFNGARVIGPVVAGIVIAHVGIPACFYLNALSFFAVLF